MYMKKITILLGILILVVLTACTADNSFFTDPNGNKYKYKLELTGTLPNAKIESKYIILTNDKTLTFDKVAQSMYSSNSTDSNGIHYYLLLSE